MNRRMNGRAVAGALTAATTAAVLGLGQLGPARSAHGPAVLRLHEAAVNQPAPPGGPGGSAYNGSVSTGQGPNASATVYDYPGGGAAPDTSLTTLGTLAEGTQVTIQCYLTGAAVTGPNGQGPGNSDVYWDQVIGSSNGFSFQIPAGHTAIVPDAFIDTGNTTVDQLVPACNPGSGGAAPPVAGGSPPANGPGTASPAPPAGSPGTGPHDPIPVPAAGGACTDVEVVFARGTGELTTDSDGLGYPGGVFVRALPGDLPGKTISYHAVQYPADVSQSGVPQGADDMTNWVTSEAARCPDTKFVLGGYSQGASVVDLALGLGPTVAKAYVAAAAGPAAIATVISPVIGLTGAGAAAALAGSAAGYQGRLSSLSGRIAAVVTFGNPIHWSGEDPQAASPDYASKWSDFCNYGDPVCDSLPPLSSGFLSDPLAAHKTYDTDGSATTAANDAASMVNAS